MKLNKIRLLFSALTVFSLGALVGCEDDSATENRVNNNYVSLGELPQDVVVSEGETVTIQAKIYAGRPSNVDRVIDLRVIFESAYNDAHPTTPQVVDVTTVGEDDFTVPASVTIPAGATEATFSVNVTDVDLGFDGKQIVIGIVPKKEVEVASSFVGTVEAGDYEVIDKRLVINAVRRCEQNSLRVEVFTDNFGSETTWTLYDASFNYVEGIDGPVGPYQDGILGVQDTRSFCLGAGEYTLLVEDESGDGMNDGTNQGYVRLYTVDAAGNETEIFRTATFATEDIYTFTLN